MKIILIINFLIIFFSISSGFVKAEDKPIYKTQAEINIASRKDLEKVNDKLKLIIKKVKKIFKKDSLFLNEFDNSQRAWVNYKEAMVENLYPKMNSEKINKKNNLPYCMLYGTIDIGFRYSYMRELTEDRIKQLKRLVKLRCLNNPDIIDEEFCQDDYIENL